MVNWKGFGRKRLWPNRGIYLKGLRKMMKNLRVLDVAAEIQTEHLLSS
jgi:hypothetical protein